MKVIQKRVVHPKFDIYGFFFTIACEQYSWTIDEISAKHMKHYKLDHVLVLNMFKKTKHTDIFSYVYMFSWIGYFDLNLIELMLDVRC
jgi:hypothetical protein